MVTFLRHLFTWKRQKFHVWPPVGAVFCNETIEMYKREDSDNGVKWTDIMDCYCPFTCVRAELFNAAVVCRSSVLEKLFSVITNVESSHDAIEAFHFQMRTSSCKRDVNQDATDLLCEPVTQRQRRNGNILWAFLLFLL